MALKSCQKSNKLPNLVTLHADTFYLVTIRRCLVQNYLFVCWFLPFCLTIQLRIDWPGLFCSWFPHQSLFQDLNERARESRHGSCHTWSSDHWTSVTRWPYYLFNIWPLMTMKFAQKHKIEPKYLGLFGQILCKLAKKAWDVWNFAKVVKFDSIWSRCHWSKL